MIDVVAGDSLDKARGDLLVVPVLSGPTWGPGADWAVAKLGDWVDEYLAAQEFSGKAGQMATVPGGDAVDFGRVVFIGMGDEVDAEGLRRGAGTVGRAVSKYASVVTTLHELEIEDAAEAVAFGFISGQYRFDKYLSEPKPAKTETLVLSGADAAAMAAADRGAIIAAGVALARDLVNEPAGAKPPAYLAGVAEEIAADTGLKITVYDEEACVAERFGGLLGVAAGAANPPRMVVLRHEPEGAEASVVLVGKGIVFDSGGLSLKPPAAMETMKTDMSGAAAVFGAMQAIALLDVPVKVIGIAPLTENMPGGAALRPGDVLRARNGKTIEVLNTDAEGRLVLADGLSLAVEEEPDVIIDIATLTGACKVALGPNIGGLLGNDEDAITAVTGAAARAGENVWTLPLEKEYAPLIESPIADMKNIGGRFGGAITAALFLANFADDVPWVHLDIAGPARADKAEHYIPKGATGFGVRTMVALAQDLARN
jgi:leucyl aminopeptidase